MKMATWALIFIYLSSHIYISLDIKHFTQDFAFNEDLKS